MSLIQTFKEMIDAAKYDSYFGKIELNQKFYRIFIDELEKSEEIRVKKRPKKFTKQELIERQKNFGKGGGETNKNLNGFLIELKGIPFWVDYNLELNEMNVGIKVCPRTEEDKIDLN